MRARGPLVVACALLTPCDAAAQPGGPLETAVKFLEARQAFRCRDVWPLYSAGTQENIRAAVHRRERSREGLPLGEVALRFSDPRDDPNARQTAVLWDVEGDSQAPVYLRGSWRLTPYPDGTRVTLFLAFDSRQWPGNPIDGIFSRERVAEAVLGLGK